MRAYTNHQVQANLQPRSLKKKKNSDLIKVSREPVMKLPRKGSSSTSKNALSRTRKLSNHSAGGKSFQASNANHNPISKSGPQTYRPTSAIPNGSKSMNSTSRGYGHQSN